MASSRLNSGVNTICPSTSSTIPLWRGMPNLDVKGDLNMATGRMVISPDWFSVIYLVNYSSFAVCPSFWSLPSAPTFGFLPSGLLLRVPFFRVPFFRVPSSGSLPPGPFLRVPSSGSLLPGDFFRVPSSGSLPPGPFLRIVPYWAVLTLAPSGGSRLRKLNQLSSKDSQYFPNVANFVGL